MNSFRLLASLTVAACLSTAVVLVACKTDAPQTTPPPNAGAHKFGLGINNASEIGAQLAQQGIFEWNKNWSDGADSGGSLAEVIVDGIGPGPINIPISQCQFLTAAALTASQTTYATITVYKRPGNNPDGGIAPVVIAAASTTTNQLDAAADAASTGSWFAWQNIIVPASANAFVSPGDVITVAITKTSTGVGVPQGILTCYTTIL